MPTRMEICSRILSLQDKWIAPLSLAQKYICPAIIIEGDVLWPARLRRSGNFLYIFTRYEYITYLEFEQDDQIKGSKPQQELYFFSIFLDFFLLSRTG